MAHGSTSEAEEAGAGLLAGREGVREDLLAGGKGIGEDLLVGRSKSGSASREKGKGRVC